MNRTRLAAGAALALAIGFAGFVLARTDWKHAIEPSPLALIPASDTSRELTAVRQLAGDAQSRAMLALVESPSGRAAEAAETMRATLLADPTIPGLAAVNPHDMTARRDSGATLFARRDALLLPHRLERLRKAVVDTGAEPTPEALAKQAAGELDRFLETDAAFAFEKLLPQDPLLLLPKAMEPLLREAGPAPVPEKAMLWVDTDRPPLDKEAQAPVFAAWARAESAMRAAVPDAKISHTGVNAFATASEAGIRGELSLLNIVALAGVALVCAVVLRRVAILPHVAVVTGLSIALSWSVSLLVFDRIHVFAIALGALLSGICVDYTLYVMLHDGADDKPASFHRLRPLIRPLLASGFVASVGFAFLIFSPLPAIRQTGVFITAGVFSALVLSVAYGSLVRFRHGAAEASDGDQSANTPVEKNTGRRRRRFALAVFLIAAAGAPLVVWNDSLKDLEYPLKELRATDRHIRGAFGESSRSLWLVSGKTCGEALDTLARFSAHADAATGKPGMVRGPLTMLATPGEHAVTDSWIRRDGARFATAFAGELTARGYDTRDFEPFFTAWKPLVAEGLPAHEPAADVFLRALTGPESMLVSLNGPDRLLVCWTETGATLPEPPAEINAFPLNRLESLNRTLGHYRQNMLALILAGFATTVALSFLLVRRRDALLDFAVPAGAALAAYGIAGWCGFALSIFHLAGAFLAVCCSLNYSVFAREARRAGLPFPKAVTLAWLTTATSFGALCFSSIPAVFALGATVVCLISLAYLTVRFVPARRISVIAKPAGR